MRIALIASVVAAALLATAAPAAALDKGKPAPDFELKGRDGTPLRLSSLRGKVVLVDFWASWCEPCKKELPLLAAMARKLKPSGVEILAINIDTRRDAAEAFLKDHGVTLPVLFDPDGNRAASKYDPPTMPTSFVVDVAGVVRYVNSGFEDGDEKKIEKQLVTLRKAAPAAATEAESD